jgi:hypothetical protein
MAVMFTHFALMHKGGNFEAAKEVIDFALNVNMVLRLGGDTVLVHLSPLHPFPKFEQYVIVIFR